MEEKKLNKLTFEELEKEENACIAFLSENTNPLDESVKVYKYSKKIIAEMNKRIDDLTKEITDEVVDN